MLRQIALSPISRRCEILFVHRSAFPYLVLTALKTDSTVDRAWYSLEHKFLTVSIIPARLWP